LLASLWARTFSLARPIFSPQFPFPRTPQEELNSWSASYFARLLAEHNAKKAASAAAAGPGAGAGAEEEGKE